MLSPLFPHPTAKQGGTSSLPSPQATPSEDPTPDTSALTLLRGLQRPASPSPARPHLEETSWRRSGPTRAGGIYKPVLRHSRRGTSLTPIGPRSQPRRLRLPAPSPSASAARPLRKPKPLVLRPKRHRPERNSHTLPATEALTSLPTLEPSSTPGSIHSGDAGRTREEPGVVRNPAQPETRRGLWGLVVSLADVVGKFCPDKTTIPSRLCGGAEGDGWGHFQPIVGELPALARGGEMKREGAPKAKEGRGQLSPAPIRVEGRPRRHSLFVGAV